MRWEALRKHPFWEEEIPALTLPSEPVFEKYLISKGINPQKYYEQKVSEADPKKENSEISSSSTFHTSRIDKRSDILRLSQAVKKNLLKENSDYSTIDKDIKIDANDVCISNKDQDLNFGEHSDEEDGQKSKKEESNEQKSNIEAIPVNKVSPTNKNVQHENVVAHIVTNSQKSSRLKKQQSEEEKKPDFTFTKGVDIGAQMDVGGYMPDSTQPKPIEDLLINASDNAVKPIIGNKDIEKTADPVYDHSMLPFQPIKPEDFEERVNNPEFEKHLSIIFQAIASCADVVKSNNIFLYFESLIMNSAASNKIINTDYMTVLCSLLENIGNSMLKTRICSIIGYLIRHATTITNELSESGLIGALISLSNDSNLQLRRKAISAAGEYLFYAATQMDDNQSEHSWDIKVNQYDAFLKCLKLNDDIITKAYALKTIENILSQSSNGGLKFSTEAVYNLLIGLCKTSEIDSIKTSATVALAHLCKLEMMSNINHGFINLIMGDIGIVALSSMLSESSQKMQQSILLIIALFLYHCYKKTEKILLDSKQFLANIGITLESSNQIIKGKSMIILAILVTNNSAWIMKFNECKLTSAIDKVTKETNKYAKQALHTYISIITETVTHIMSKAIDDLTDLVKLDKIKDAEYLKCLAYPKLEGSHTLLPSIADMFFSASYKLSIVNPKFILSLSKLLEQCEYKHYNSQLELKQVIFLIIEGLSKVTKALMINKEIILQNLIPVLSSKFKSPNLDTRCECFKLFMAMAIQYLNEESAYDPKSNSVSTKLINEKIITSLLPFYGNLLSDKDPIPSFALALLHAILEKNSSFVSWFGKLKLTDVLFEYFVVGHPMMNNNTVKIIKIIIESGEVSLTELCHFEAFDKVSSAIEYMAENQIDSTAEDLIEIIISLLKQFNEQYKSGSINCSSLNNSNELIPDSLLSIYRKMRVLAAPIGHIVKYVANEMREVVDKSTQYLIMILQLYQGCKCKGMADIRLKSEHMQYLINGLISENISIQKRLLKCILYGLKQKDEQIIIMEVQKEILKDKLMKLNECEDKSLTSTVRDILRKL